MKISGTKLQQGILIAGTLSMFGCGNAPQHAPYNVDYGFPEKVDASEIANANTPEVAETYYGMVTKCLVEAEEIKSLVKSASAAPVIQQKILCSPKMSASSTEELSRRLDLWKKSHCATTIAVKNSPCSVVADPAQNVISNDASAIDQRFKDKEYCAGKKGSTYGTLKCQ